MRAPPDQPVTGHANKAGVNMRRILCVLVCAILQADPVVAAEEARFVSGPKQTAMIELFTSEGCSSCPPAEAYLNRLTLSPALWKTIVPLAFHVDYWDYIGWKDRFADPAHALRQRQYAQQHSIRTVYTPAFIVNGQGWRPSRTADEPNSSGAAVGTLTVHVAGTRLEATFVPTNPSGTGLQLNLAVLGMGLTSEIRAGENAGRHSQHEFVVLTRQQMSSDNGRFRGTLQTPKTDMGAPRLALAAWVSRPGDPTPLQATGGYLPGNGPIGAP
jgi:hypothetical protein